MSLETLPNNSPQLEGRTEKGEKDRLDFFWT